MPNECPTLPPHLREGLDRLRRAIEARDGRQATGADADRAGGGGGSVPLSGEDEIHRLLRQLLEDDDETAAHIRRTGLCSALLAVTVGWEPLAVARIRLAAPLHDIGKIGVSPSILRKPGPLTPDETRLMRKHTVIGGEMLEGSRSPVLEMAREIALNHHERWDGSGYPEGLAGPAIPECARIVAVVDVFDALSHDRVYRRAAPRSEVIGILEKGRGAHFDPRLLDAFLSQLPQMEEIAQSSRDEAE